MLGKKDVKIYMAGKTWSAHWYREMVKRGFISTARWINEENVLKDATDIMPDSVHQNEGYKRDIWAKCKTDCFAADMGIIAAHPDDGNMHSGSLVELGHITALDRPVYILGTCASFEPAGDSDRAWKSQPCVYYWPEYDVTNADALEIGMLRAVRHYIENYTDQWFQNNPFSSQMWRLPENVST